MFYGAYKNVRNSAWQCLIDFKINSLPVDVLQIAKAADIKVIKNSLINELKESELGAALCDGDKWYIIYDDTLSSSQKRFVVAHELGHIFLGHRLKNGHFIHDNYKLEKEANSFASKLLSPACVLWGLDLHSTNEISKQCNLTSQQAAARARRMSVLYKRQMFLKSDIEKKVYKLFEDYIQKEIHAC